MPDGWPTEILGDFPADGIGKLYLVLLLTKMGPTTVTFSA